MEKLGRYTLVERIGEGGMAQVYKARLDGPMGFRKELAIKRIKEHVVREDGEHIQALINEARIGGQLKHPNIVEVYEFGQVDGAFFVAMELVDGVTLSELVRAARDRGQLLPPSFTIDVAMQVCHGLAYAHTFTQDDASRESVVHRDLKPSNIMVGKGGSAKIMDFGIAKTATPFFDTTSTGIAKGTPLYMSPEQLRGMRPLPTNSDLFSLGVIVWEMVCGELLFGGRTIPEIITRVLSMPLEEEIARAEQRVPGIGPILTGLLERDVASRTQDPRDVEVELKHLLDWQDHRLSTAEIVLNWMKDESLPGDGTATRDAEPARARPPLKASESMVAAYLRAKTRRRWGVGAAALAAAMGLAGVSAYVFRGTLGLEWAARDGDAALAEGDIDAAWADWERVLETSPGNEAARPRAAALRAWLGVTEAGKADLLDSLARMREDDPGARAAKYRAIALVHRWTGDDRQAMVHLSWAREALEAAGQPLPPALRWELGEVAVLRGAQDAAARYFTDLSATLDPGAHADAASAWTERLERGEGDLLAAELRWLDGNLDDDGWTALPDLLKGRGGSRDDREEDRLVWSFRALDEGRWELAETLVKPLGLLPGEPERRRSQATVLSAAAAGQGQITEARKQLGIALDKAATPEASAATRLQVCRGLLASGAEPRWLESLLEEAAVEVTGADPDVRLLLAWRDGAVPTLPPARRWAMDARTGRLHAGVLGRGGPHAARLVPAEGFGVANHSPSGLAWPFGPAFHPFDDSPLPVFFHPGR